MEHVEVTEDMQKRVLRNVDRHFSNKKNVRKRAWLAVFGSLTAAVVIIVVIRPWNNNLNSGTQEGQYPSGVMGIFNEQQYASAEELADAVGFSMPEIENVPFQVLEQRYISLQGAVAQIDYNGKDEYLTFRKSVGAEDNSGDYNLYGTEKVVKIGQVQVTLKGNDNGVCLAIWTEGEYSYSLNDVNGLSEEVMIQMIKEIIIE